VDEAPDALEMSIRNAVRHGVATPDQKADAVAHVAPLIAKVSDAVSRDEYTRRLALAVSASPAAVASLVREAARNSSRTTQVDAESLGLERGRRDGPEDRQLRALGRFCLLRPELVSDETALKLAEILPEGSWKAIIMQIIEAAGDGLLRTDGEGGVDAFAIEARLDEDARRRLREIAVDDSPLDSERPGEQVLEDLIGWFDARRAAAREKELKRMLGDPTQDHDALLAERHALLLERRARMRVGTEIGKHTGSRSSGGGHS
jgi:hypothetical protein